MDVEALNELRRVCENVPEDRLHMQLFVNEGACGTAYCLLGWASLDPYFQEHGLVSAQVDKRAFDRNLTKMERILDIDNADALFASNISTNADPHAGDEGRGASQHRSVAGGRGRDRVRRG